MPEPNETNVEELTPGMDRDERTAAALEEFNKPLPDEGKTAEGSSGAAAGTEGAQATGADKGAADPGKGDAGAAADQGKPAEAAPADIAKAPFFNDPAFQSYHKVAEENKTVIAAFHDVFDKGRYKIADTQNLQAVLEDSFTLYDIAAGKAKVGELLDLFEKNWDPATFKAVLTDMAAYAKSKGIGAGAAEGEETPPANGETKPGDSALAKEVADLKAKIEAGEKSRSAEEKTRADAAEAKERMDTVVAPLMDQVTKLCKARGVEDAADVTEYNLAVSDAIGKLSAEARQKALDQIKAGKWGEVERLFSEYHNRMVARAARLANSKAADAAKTQEAIPRHAAGGTNPAPPAKKRDLRTSDGRTAAALEEWGAKK